MLTIRVTSRDHLIAASLKARPRIAQGFGQSSFPRSLNRGLIEGWQALGMGWLDPASRDHLIAASLKVAPPRIPFGRLASSRDHLIAASLKDAESV